MRCKALLLVALLASYRSGHAYEPAQGPLMTRWAADVSPTKVLPEYPRPTLVRRDWLNLNGLWDYAILPRTNERVQEYQGQILVPFAVESALSGVMKRLQPDQHLWYRRSFEVPGAWAGRRVLLHFGAVDWEAQVWVNGRELGVHRGGYDGFSFDVTPALKPDGAQELVVRVFDPTDKGPQPRGKQVLNPHGIYYVPTSGIWQTVWLEPVPDARIAGLKATPDLARKALHLVVNGANTTEKDAVTAVALDEGREVARVEGRPGQPLTLALPEPRAWTPETPFLYDLKVTLVRDGNVVDAVDSYFGMRSIEVRRDEQGVPRILLNGRFVFQVGPLDQGFWPDGLYTAPTDEALRYDIEITKKLGFNMARKHVKVEPERWYYWCDRLGLLVWQDMPSGDRGVAPGKGEIERSPESARIFETELKAMLDARHHHPCIVMWVVFNEGWGQYDTVRLTRWTRSYDPSRLANCASGWNDYPAGDVVDMHNYPGPGAPKYDAELNRAAVLGEFGGLGLPVEGHRWTKEHWGYRGMSSPQALTRRYVQMLQKSWALKDSAGLNAVVYTQTTDVETECNGLLTYDRAVIKPDLEKVARANRGEAGAETKIAHVVPCAPQEAVTWRYTTEKPADGWEKPGFDATAWKEGPAGFGTQGTPGATVRTEWKTGDIWLRREFTLPEAEPKNPVLWLHHDEDAEVFVNGVLAAKADGFVSEYDLVDLSEEARKTLKAGRNLMAIHCRQTRGGQYIDAGLVEVQE